MAQPRSPSKAGNPSFHLAPARHVHVKTDFHVLGHETVLVVAGLIIDNEGHRVLSGFKAAPALIATSIQAVPRGWSHPWRSWDRSASREGMFAVSRPASGRPWP